MKGDGTRVVDLQGKLYAPPSGPGRDVPSIIAELKRCAAQRNTPKGGMIMAHGYDDTVMPDGRLLNCGDLDEAFPDNPVRVDHVSMHGAVMNSLALQKYGISARTKTPPGGVIVRKPGTEEPWGLIMETDFLPVVEQAEPMTAEQEIAWSYAGQMLYAEAGVTTAQEGATHLPQFQIMKRASDAGLQPSNHTDFVVAPLDQMMMLWSAVKRVSRAGDDIGPDQRVTPYEGLKAMTEWVAEQFDEEATRGTLATGKLADLVILDKDPLKVEPMAIRGIKVVETIKEGVTIYPAPAES